MIVSGVRNALAQPDYTAATPQLHRRYTADTPHFHRMAGPLTLPTFVRSAAVLAAAAALAGCSALPSLPSKTTGGNLLGVITGYSVRLNQATLEKSLQAYVGLSVEPRAGRAVLKRLAKMPERPCLIGGAV